METVNNSNQEQVVLTRNGGKIASLVLLCLGAAAILTGAALWIFAYWFFEEVVYFFAGGLVFVILGLLCGFQLVVTTKRVFVNMTLARRISIPLDQISAVGTSLFNSIHIGSSSAHIRLLFVPKYMEIYGTITTLLNQTK